MISSEVQRTLVKSPPELWTELSDPEALARHLGELGEIRITRTEPENLVEWEAEGTTGTVEIAPSGWGTRVKLTVVRELPAEPAAETGIDAQDAVTAETGPEAAAAEIAPAPDGAAAPVVPDAEADFAPAPDPEADVALAPDAETTPDAAAEPVDAEAAPDEPEDEAAEPAEPVLPRSAPESEITERKPAPATEAARRAAGWPAGGHAPGPAIESDLRAAEALEGAPVEPDGMHEWAAQAIEPDEGDLKNEYGPEEEPEPPKRGLFARLFGRRRGRAKATPLEEPELPRDAFEEDSDDTALEDTFVSEAHELQPEQLEPADAEPGEPHTASEELERAEAEPIEPQAQAEEAAPTDAPDDSEPELADPAPLPAQDAEDAERAAEEPGQRIAGDATEIARAEEPTAAEEPSPATPAQDLAAELRAAEDVATEQVEAVLTGVLDRLGSAHHRPFSRP